MQNSRKHHLFHAGTGLFLMLAAACSGDDTDSTDQGVGSGGTSASAGNKASGGRSGSTASPSSGGTRAPSGTSNAPTTAGKGGNAAPSGGAGRVAGDEDAGVSPDAGGPKAGAGGSSAGSSAAGSGGRAGTPSAAGSGGSSSAQAATFTQVYALFMTNCALAGCHGTGRAGDNLSMVDKATAYKNLVDADSVSCSGAKRVVAGDTDKSELVHTLQHTMLAGCARTPKMPDNKPMLAQSDIDLVVSWVKAGAQND